LTRGFTLLKGIDIARGVTLMIADVKPAVVAKLKNYERILRCSSSAIDCARMGDL
jgi:hypothetical protein